jgi:hypothetical protein
MVRSKLINIDLLYVEAVRNVPVFKVYKKEAY